MDFLFQISLFLGMAVYYARWEHKHFVKPYLEKEKDESPPKEREMKSSLMKFWGHALLDSSISKALVLLAFTVYLAISIWGATRLESGQASSISLSFLTPFPHFTLC